MDDINPPLLPGQTVPRGLAPPTAAGSSTAAAAATEGLVVDVPPVGAAALGKRKRLGQHVVSVPPVTAALPAPAAPAAPAKRAKRPGNKASTPALKKATPKKAVKKPAATKMASLTALTAAMAKASDAARRWSTKVPSLMSRRSRKLTCSMMLPSTSTRAACGLR
jgi:hypothetical protein